MERSVGKGENAWRLEVGVVWRSLIFSHYEGLFLWVFLCVIIIIIVTAVYC